MNRRLTVLLVLVSLISGCGGGTIDSIKKMAPAVLLVSLVAFTSLAHDRRLTRQTAQPRA